MTRPDGQRCIAAFIVGVLFGLVLGFGTPASASGCIAPTTVQDARYDPSYPPTHWIYNRGIKVHDPNGMYVHNDTITCDRISSIEERSADLQVLEFGYQEWNLTNYPPFCSPTQGAGGVPHWFIYYLDYAAKQHCYRA